MGRVTLNGQISSFLFTQALVVKAIFVLFHFIITFSIVCFIHFIYLKSVIIKIVNNN